MTIVTAGPQMWTWSPEVLAFAQEAGVAPYLDPLMEATREQFPDAREMRIFVEQDPEIVNDRHIGWEIDLAIPDLRDFRRLSRLLGEALVKTVPAPLTCVFRQYLLPVK